VLSVSTTIAVSVVPMPRCSALLCAPWKMAALASTTAATATSTDEAPLPRRSRMVLAAMALATSPA
jgi:hypothetical protein